MTELSPKAAALVRAGKGGMRPSLADRERVSAALRARLGDAALAIETAPDVSLVSRAKWAKLSALTAVIGLAGGAALFAWQKPAPLASAVPLQARQQVEPPARAVTQQAVDEAEPTAASLSKALPAPAASSAQGPADRLAQEVAIMSRATSELHAGRPANTLKAVAEHQRKFPNGLLAEERRAARVQALCALGRSAEAAPELARLSRIAPTSPNTLRAARLCAERAGSK